MSSTRSQSEMTEAKHTPGPWITDRTVDENKLAVRPKNSPFAICVFEAFVKNSEANARLIAAAPDLLEALKQIADFHIGDCPAAVEEVDFAKNINREIRKIASAALLKAGA